MRPLDLVYSLLDVFAEAWLTKNGPRRATIRVVPDGRPHKVVVEFGRVGKGRGRPTPEQPPRSEATVADVLSQSFTVQNDADHAVSVEFESIPAASVNVSFSWNAGGTVTGGADPNFGQPGPSSAVDAISAPATYNAQAAPGSRIKRISVDGVDQPLS